MNRRFDGTLARVAGEVFERLAFMLSMPMAEGEEAPPPGATAGVAFSGPCSGFLRLRISDHLLPVLAANMLGIDEGSGIERPEQEDALKELLTVLCGTLLPEIAGSTAVFDLGVPWIFPGNAAEEPEETGTLEGHAAVSVDDGYAEVCLYVSGEIPVHGAS